MAFGCTITVDTGKIPSSQSDFVWLATADNFPTAAKDGGTNSILNGGGNLRCYTDDTKATQLPIEVVTFVTGGSPVIQVWGLSPTLNVASTVYIEADDVATTQPAVGAAFGRNAVWVNFEYNFHFESTSELIDSTGNYSLTKSGTIIPVSGVIGDASDSANNIANYYTVTGYTGVPGAGARTHSGWTKTSSDISMIDYGVNTTGNRYTIRVDAGSFRHELQGSFAKTTSTAFSDGAFHKFSIKTDGSSSWPGNQSISVDGVNEALTVGGAATLDTIPTADLTFKQAVGGSRPNGIYDEFSLRLFETSTDYDASEYNNQSDPSTFWTTSAWVEQSSGITIAATLGAINYASQDVTVQLSGVVDVTATLGSINYTSQDTTIQLSGDINVNAGLGTINYASQDTTVQLSGEIIANATLGLINYSSNDVVVGLTGGISLTATLGTIEYSSQDTTVTLQGQIVIPATLGTITYDSNNVIVGIGEGQIIGVVTAGFADDLFSSSFKPDEITVSFKT